MRLATIEITGSAGAGVWRYWCETSTATAYYAGTSNYVGPWEYWCSGGTSTTPTSTITDTIYKAWVIKSSEDEGSAYASQIRPKQSHIESEADRTARLQREQANRQAAELQRLNELARREAAVKEREAAVAKAERLLLETLKEEQRKQYQKDRHFDVITKDGKRRYRIHHGSSGNVKLLNEKGHSVKSYCIHAVDQGIPNEDNMLLQKLLIEHDEERFLKTANISNVHQPEQRTA